jgi:release factor glutamine methyltransferase
MSDAGHAPDSMRLADVLREANLPQQEARILLGFALGLSRVQLITQSDSHLKQAQTRLIQSLFARRLSGEPIAYITGTREFYGLDFQVSPAVLIPRADTELLVELALARLPHGASVLDMGTGSGAIAVAIAHARPDVRVTALDASAAALDVARANATRHGVVIRFLQSDWFSALRPSLETDVFDLIVSNPPYIQADDVHLSQGDLRHEPADALTDHADGLRALRHIIARASHFLQTDGWLLLEHGYDQSTAVRALLLAQGMSAPLSWRDLAGIERVSGARRATA